VLIRTLTPRECHQVMTRTVFGRLGCAKDNQPYVVPIYFAYEPYQLYGFATVGRKIEWMRKNPKVCVEVDEIVDHYQWKSVIVTGRYQELPNTPKFSSERLHALRVLEKRLLWWQTALAAKQLPTKSATTEPLFYCIYVDSITGVCAIPDSVESKISRRNMTPD